jgi:transposase-like protein
MRQVRKQYSPKFKARVALEAIKGQRTTNEIAAAYSVHPNLIQKWKRQVLDLLPDLFADGRSASSRASQSDEQLQSQLYQQIGQLKVELDWLKKKAGLLLD